MACRAVCLYTIVILSVCFSIANAVYTGQRIYDVSLQNGWQDWSYASVLDTESTSGSNNVISAQLGFNTNGLYLRAGTPLTKASWYGLEFRFQMVTSTKNLEFILNTDAGGIYYFFDASSITANTFNTLTIPWASFNQNKDKGTYNPAYAYITGVEVKTRAADNSDTDGTRTVNFQYITVVKNSGDVYSAYSYTTTPSQAGALVYDSSQSGLQMCWSDWSNAWVGAGNYQTTGGYSFYPKNDFKGIYFSSARSFDGNAMGTLSYKIYATNGARKRTPVTTQYKVVLFDDSATPAPIGDGYIIRIGSSYTYGQWNQVSLPISIFNIPTGTKVTGIAFMGTKYAQASNGVNLKFDVIKFGTPPTKSATSCSSLYGDPIIRGFDGEQYDFKGVPNRIFNILSLPDLQINSYFIAGLGDNETYSGAIGIKQGDASFISFDLNTASLHDPNTTAIAKHLAFPLNNFELPNGGLVSRPRPGTLSIKWPFYSIEMRRMFEIRKGVEFNYIDLGVTLNIDNLKQGEIHGALGQTYHRNGVKGGGTYDGVWEDYVAAKSDMDIFTSEFPQKFFRYNPSQTPKYISGDKIVAAASGYNDK